MCICLVIRRLDPGWVQQHAIMESDHEIFSTVIISLLLIQEGQLLVSDSCGFLTKKCSQVLLYPEGAV